MSFIPNTIVRLCTNIPLDSTYKHTFKFDSLDTQMWHFMGKAKYTFTNDGLGTTGFTYQRVNDTLIVPKVADDCYDCNYLMFQNSNFGAKWFYAFVKSVKYLTPNSTAISYEIDVMQTWQFDYTLMPSFVEREHVNDDSLFANLVPENLEYGDNILVQEDFYDMMPMAIVLAYNPIDINADAGAILDGVFTGIKYTFFGTSSSEITALNNLIQSFAEAGNLEAIISIFMIPAVFVVNDPLGATIQDSFISMNGYTPKNKKLFNYPYCYLGVNNCAGNEAQYKYEYFSVPAYKHFTIDSQCNMASTCNCHPDNYKGWAENWDEGIVLDNFPVCSWVGNIYSNWYALNKMSLTQSYINAGMGMAMSSIALNPTGIVSGIGAIANTLIQTEQKQIAPQQIQGQIKCAVSNVKWGRVGFMFKRYRIKAQYAQRIDNFFSMFGYKVTTLKVPNITGRASWNYVKTIDANVVGSVPVDNMDSIKANFNNGITFWHGDYIGDYTRNNGVI